MTRAREPGPGEPGPPVVVTGRWFDGSGAVADGRAALYCLPHAGGSSSSFRGWSGALAEVAEVRTVELPGHGRRLRETPYRRMAELVDDLASAIVATTAGHFALYGHSMGGLVAFEVVRWLRRHGAPQPDVLIVGGRRAAHLQPPYSPSGGLSEDEFVSRLLDTGALPSPAAQSPGFRTTMLPMLRADIELLESYTYAPGPPLSIPLVAIAGDRDDVVERADIAAWAMHSDGQFELHDAPGGHFFHQLRETSRDGSRSAIQEIVAGALGAHTSKQRAR